MKRILLSILSAVTLGLLVASCQQPATPANFYSSRRDMLGEPTPTNQPPKSIKEFVPSPPAQPPKADATVSTNSPAPPPQQP